MNIKDFLMDNYIYIIIVIVLIIVTIIGFLADKQKNGKKNKVTEQPLPNNGNSEVAPQPITYQPVNNNQMNNLNTIPNTNLMPNNQLNNVGNSNVTPLVPNNTMMNQGNFGNTIQNTPQPVEPMAASVISAPEPMYQPLSEQKPVIAPVNPINNINNFGNGLNNQPVPNPEPLQQPINNAVPNNIMNGPNSFNQPIVEPTKVENIMPTNMNGGQPSNDFNNGTPYNQQPVNPQPIPNPVENTVPSPITPPQPTTPQPVGFVYGQPNQNNNQPM